MTDHSDGWLTWPYGGTHEQYALHDYSNSLI